MRTHLLFLFLLIFISTSTSFAQTRISRNNYSGNWTNTASWVGGVAPPVTNIAIDIEIFGYITRDGSLSFANNNSNKAIVINDTLVVTGSMSFGNNAQELVVGPSGVLIVFGNFSATNRISLSNGGIFVVGGNMALSPSGHSSYTGNGELFVQGSITGNTTAANTGDLETTYPNIYNFLMGNTSTLPVKVLNFSAKAGKTSVQLDWSTSSEKNFDYFTVERSSDLKNFYAIGKVKGSGNSTAILNYNFTDNNPLPGTTYYRLKATDFDGTIEYHQVIKVTFARVESAKLNVFPNPLSGQDFSITSPISTGTLRLYNIVGKEIFNANLENGTSFHLNKPLDPGLYVVIVEAGNNKFQTKLTVK